MIQSRIVRDINNLQDTKVPSMPILIVNNGMILEASTIKGTMASIVGNEYYDAEDAEDEWHYRLESARKISMMENSKNIKICSDGQKIKNNYAAAENDPDYEEDRSTSYVIDIKDEKSFILSIIKLKIDSIKILERDDSKILKEFKEEITKEYEGGIYEIITA